MSTKPIRRITLFKIPTEEGQEQLLAKYRTLPQEALKVFLTISLSHFQLIPELIKPFRTARHTSSTSKPARRSPTSAPRASLWPSLQSSRTRRIWFSTTLSAQVTWVSRKWLKPCTRAS